MRKRIFYIFVFITCLFATFGCSVGKYNATFFDDAEKWINAEFVAKNLIGNVYYPNGDEGEYIKTDDSYPKNRTFVIRDTEQLKEISVSNAEELKVDFNKQMLIVYTYGALNRRKLELSDIKKNGDILQIFFKSETKTGVGDTCMPYQRWVVVKLNKSDFNLVEFKQK